MGFRFRKTISIMPGVRVNLSKSGSSVSVGRRGATVNVGRRGTFFTAGIPGSGLSWRERVSQRSPNVGVITLAILAAPAILYAIGHFFG